MYEKKEKNKNITSFYLDIFQKYKFKFITLIILIIVSSLIGIGVAYVYMKVIDCITDKPFNRIVTAVLFYFLLNVLNYIFSVLVTCINKKISNNIDIDIRKKIFYAVLKQDSEKITHTDSSEYISILTTDAMRVSEFFGNVIFPSLLALMRIIGMVVFLWIIQRRILAVVAVIQPVLYLVQGKMQKNMKTISQKSRTNTVAFIRTIKEYTSNLFKIRMLGRNDFFKEKFSSKLVAMKESELQSSVTNEVYGSFMGTINIIPIIIIMLIGGYEISNQTATIGVLMIYIQYYQSLFSPITEIMEAIFESESYKPSINRIITLFGETKPNVKSAENTKCDTIELKNVSFGYPGKKIVFKKLNLKMRKGRIYGIIGESGCGKSTFCRLILGLWKCSEGEVLIGGKNVNLIDKDVFYQNISYLSQDDFLFNESIYNNVSLGRDISNEEFDAVMKKVNLYDTIKNLPEGKESIVGDNGILLSGGQKKRIELARLLVNKSPILILDEPTTGLDNENASEIMSIFMEEFKESLVIIVSHQMDIIEMCGNIFDMKNRKWLKKI